MFCPPFLLALSAFPFPLRRAMLSAMRKEIARKLWFWLPPVAWAAAIFSISFLPIKPRPPGYPGEDKVVHLFLYGILALLLLRAYLGDRGMTPRRAAVFAFIVTLLYGMFDEWQQSFLPERTAELLDLAADAAGAAVAVIVAARATAKKGKPT